MAESIYRKASLSMIPYGAKEDVLPSIKPTDGTGDFTFSRNADIQATRVNASGLIEKAKVNLALQSNSFSTSPFTLSNLTLTSGQAGYDGTNDAWLITKGGAYGSAFQTNISATSGAVYTASVYMKANASNFGSIRLSTGSGADYRIKCDLTSGTTSTAAANNGTRIDANATDVGNGWWRVSVTGQTNNTTITINLYAGDTADASGSIYIQDAALCHGLVAQDYVETTTTSVVEGLTADLPRLDYSGGASCPSLLLEPSRTNLVAFSEYFNGSIWNQLYCSVTDNDATSPEGVTNAAKVEGDGTDNQIRLYDNYTFPSTGEYTFSVFAKAGNNDYLRLNFGGVDGARLAFYNIAEGTIPAIYDSYASIEAVGTDGWYRCSITADLTGPDLTGNYNIYVSYDDTTSSYPTNADANGKYVHIYGAQLE